MQKSNCYAIVIFLGLFASVQIASAQVPKDIERISKVYKTITSETDPDTIVQSFAELLRDNAIDIAKKSGIYRRGQFGGDKFTDFVQKRARAVQGDAGISDRMDREKALYKQLINHSTQNAAHAVIDAWLGLPGTGSLVKAAKTTVPTSMGNQIVMSSTDRRLSLVLPNKEANVADKAVNKLKALNPFASKKKAPAKPKPKPSYIVEHGGPGSGNGIIDAGEWVQLNFNVQNKGQTPFFSSSGWLSESHPCAWTPKSDEIEFPELPAAKPDQKEAPVAKVSTWVYLSTSCANNARVAVNLMVKDTHRAMSRSIILSANLRVTKRLGGAMNKLIMDGDIPGHSDNGKKPPIRPDLRLELSHGLTSGLKARQARMNWAVDKHGTSLFKKQSFRAEEPLYLEGFAWRASDDLDIQAKAEKDDVFYKAVAGVIRSANWKSKADAQVWFGTDTEVLYDSPDGPIQAKEEVKKQKEICNNYQDDDDDGKPDCLDTDCKDHKFCKSRKACPNAAAVLSLAKSNAAIVASPASTKIRGAILAVQPNYELVYNDLSFTERYNCLLKGIPAAKCGKPVCPECKVDKPEEDEKAFVNTSKARHVRYVYRHYIGVDVKIGAEDCKDGVDNDLDGYADGRDSECGARPQPKVVRRVRATCGDGKINRSSETCDDGNRVNGDGCDRNCQIEEAPEVHQWILDVGYSNRGQVEASGNMGATEFGADDISANGFKVQASYGYFTGGLMFHVHEYEATGINGFAEDFVGNDFGLTAGLAKNIKFGSIQIHPRAQVGFFSRELEGIFNFEKLAHRGSGLGFGVGATLRYKYNKSIGFFGDIDWWNDGATTERDGNELSEVETRRLGFGISFFL